MRVSRGPLFYGWVIVGIALVAQFLSAGAQLYSIGVFTKPMSDDLGWSRQDLSLVQSVITAVGGILAIFLGAQIDKRGPRLLMFAGGIIAGAATAATSLVDSYWQFFVLRGIGQAIGFALIGSLVVNVTLAKWLVVRRGMAVAIASLGISLGGVIMTPLVTWWVDSFGWRPAWALMGALLLVVSLPSALLMRKSPEDYGMLPDGMSKKEADDFAARTNRATATSEVQWTRAQAVRVPATWLIILGYGSATMGIYALIFHLVPFLTDSGFSSGKAALLFGVFAWAALLCKPVWGTLMDRVQARYLSILGFSLAALALGGIIAAGDRESVVWMVIALGIYGFAVGGILPLQETVWAGYFGRLHLGSIRAVGMPFTIFFGASGPFVGGALFELTGNYDSAFVTFAGFSVVAVVALLLARPPRHPGTPEPAHETPIAAVRSR